ncbi:MAG: amylo-alpha-1,6-glucosidase [Planctomycetota bacterium]
MSAIDQPAGADRARAAAGDGPAEREWLLVDGRGGYACGTALDLPTRRYHCWLCAPAANGRRRRYLAGADERLYVRDREFALTPAHWRAFDAPSVPELPRTFRSEPVPTLVVRCGPAAVERQLVMPRGRSAVLVRWRNSGQAPFRMVVRPLLCGEDADALLRERPVRADVDRDGDARGFRLGDDDATVWLSTAGPVRFDADPVWYRDYWLRVDAERGYDATADRFAPGTLTFDLDPGQSVTVAFAVDAPLPDPAAAFDAAAASRQQRQQWAATAGSALGARLRRGVDDFFYRDAAGRLGVLAGFPWFAEWGRDVFVALPGLTLAVDEPARCLEVLRGALPFLRRGLLPNIYGPTPATSHYDSADAALWFALCVQRWQDAGGGRDAARSQFGPALRGIAEAYLQGTDLGLRVDDEGLLFAGSRDRNATWMDAQTAAGPVTPREGQPVEIDAMWCSLLAHLGELFGGDWDRRARAVGSAFVRRFWRDDAGCLFDRRGLDGLGDPAVRPNMVIAAALPRSPLSRAQRAAVVATAQRELVTPRGLRTLSPRDPAYRPRYEGGSEQRDGAYHQGTAWPWLGGFHVEAALRAAAPDQLAEVRGRQLAWLQGFVAEVDLAGIDHLSEVFDGDAPQRPGGSFAQAWNTGELLRALRLCRHGPDGGDGPPGSGR